MQTHRYGEVKTVSSGRKFRQCIDCGQVDPVDMNTMSNFYCYPKNYMSEQEEANKLFNTRRKQ